MKIYAWACRVSANGTSTPASTKDAQPSEEQSDATEVKVPEKRSIGLITRVQSVEKERKTRTMCVSLDGLLEYEKDDKDERTFELSLAAEALHEMLSSIMAKYSITHVQV